MWHEADIKKKIIEINVTELNTQRALVRIAACFKANFIFYPKTSHKVRHLLFIFGC